MNDQLTNERERGHMALDIMIINSDDDDNDDDRYGYVDVCGPKK